MQIGKRVLASNFFPVKVSLPFFTHFEPEIEELRIDSVGIVLLLRGMVALVKLCFQLMLK